MIDDDGAIFIAVFGQGLDFTDKMDKSLINPNQCRSFGVQCVDDPTDPTRRLGFYSDDTYLPLRMEGTNCLANAFCPSDQELQQYPWVYMSDEIVWDPSNVNYPTISATSRTIDEELAVHDGHPILSISDQRIESDMSMNDMHSRLIKAVNI